MVPIYNNTVEYLKKINSLPSSPFGVGLQVELIEEVLRGLNLEYVKTNYFITVHLKSQSKSTRKLVVMSHLDHPGAVLDGNGKGIFFGSVGLERVGNAVGLGKMFLKVFSPKGENLGLAKVTCLHKQRQNFTVESDFPIPKNSTAVFGLKEFSEDRENLYVYNADNGVDTATMLALLEEGLTPVYDTYFVFNFHEEVHQISAWKLARDNFLGITQDDLVLNLEAPIIATNVLGNGPKLNYEDGIVLKLSNLDCLFGHLTPGENLLENTTRFLAKTKKLSVQIGFAKGSDEARCFSTFPYTANIATLAVPNKFKHNWGENDAFVPETIKKYDVRALGILVKAVIETEVKEVDLQESGSLVSGYKQKDEVTNETIIKDKANLNTRIDWRYKSVIKRGYYFPITLRDHFDDLLCRSMFYLIYLWQKLY